MIPVPKSEDRAKHIEDILQQLPHNPGVYQYFNDEGKIIYIGKAKNLKKRVYSYFQRDAHVTAKVRVLVSKIFDIRYIIVDTESDALLLENNLIKKYQPRYNILLKDDKTFPWLCIKKERFPRIIYTRNFINDGSEYFGPYTSIVMVKTLYSLVKKLYPLRTCNYDLTDVNIKSGKFKTCLEFHIGNCKAPCIDRQSEQEYISNIKNIKEILKGNISDISKYLDGLMKEYATALDFENAQLIKQKIEIISNYQSKSAIVNSAIHNVDVFSVAEKDDFVTINFLRVANGAIIQVHSVEIKNKLDEPIEEILSAAITDIRQKMFSNSKEIIVPFMPEMLLAGVKYTIPKVGDKLKLLELSERNAKLFLAERLKSQQLFADKMLEKKNSAVEKLKDDLRLEKAPNHIECFDNSNIQGTNPVAACVVFKNGKPSKNDYRHFNVKTVEGPDDFATMREIVYRRYKRLLDENDKLPDLIIIDGGKGQLGAALESLRSLDLIGKIQIIGIAKRLEEIFRPGDPIPLYIDKNSPSLKLIQHLRNEAHRFGITFHRLKRSENFITSELDNIKGIGEKTKEDLLKSFQSVEKIKLASFDEIAAVVGAAKARLVCDYFEKK
jgi:excinuclease ABC subunit C